MMSHDNITWTSRIILEHAKSLKKDGSTHATVSYSSINEWEIYYARPDALKVLNTSQTVFGNT